MSLAISTPLQTAFPSYPYGIFPFLLVAVVASDLELIFQSFDFELLDYNHLHQCYCSLRGREVGCVKYGGLSSRTKKSR